MEKLKFTVDSALLSELGEKLVETVHLALVELVKNSYDADAQNVRVKFVEDSSGVSEVHIIDDGIGMNFEEVRRYWMRIATTNKLKKNFSPRFGRPRTGSKGIGRFCCRRLGKSLELTTVGKEHLKGRKLKSYQKTNVVFEWEKFKPGTDVTTIVCTGKIETLKSGKTGTKLIIRDLSDEWTQRGYDFLKRQLSVLVANRGARREGYKEDPGFNIFIEVPQFEGGVRDLRDDFINAGWGTLKAYINKNHNAVCELNSLGIGRKTITSEQKFRNLNDVSLKVGILVGNKKQMRDTSIISKGILREILSEWGGVQVKYKGFRVFPYGDDDWLDIDRDRGLRKTPAKEELYAFAQSLKGVDPGRALLNLLSMNSYVGNVEIGEKAKGFDMKANREGFLSSSSVDELKSFARFAINWATICRDYFLRKKAEEDAEVARIYLQEFLGETIEPGKMVESAVMYLKKEVKNISSLLPNKERKNLDNAFNQTTEAIVKHEESNKEELSHLRLVASTSTLLLIFSHEVKSLLGLLENSSNTLRIIQKSLKSEDRKLMKDIEQGLVDAKNRFDELLSMTSLIGVDSRKEKPRKLALLERIQNAENTYRLILKTYEIDIDYSKVLKNIVLGPMLEAEVYAILLNTLSNSIKSVIAAGGDKIRITADRFNGKTRIKIMDTGLGLDPSKFEDAFIPFIADVDGRMYKKLEQKLNPEDKYIVGTGSGLGLSIIREIIQVRNGTVAFREPKGKWKSELEVILP